MGESDAIRIPGCTEHLASLFPRAAIMRGGLRRDCKASRWSRGSTILSGSRTPDEVVHVQRTRLSERAIGNQLYLGERDSSQVVSPPAASPLPPGRTPSRFSFFSHYPPCFSSNSGEPSGVVWRVSGDAPFLLSPLKAQISEVNFSVRWLQI